MKRNMIFMLTIGLVFLVNGCAFETTGVGSWEAYAGVRTKQISEQPAKVIIQSTVIDKIVDLLTGPNKTLDQ